MLSACAQSSTAWTSQESCHHELIQDARDQKACRKGLTRPHLHLLQDAVQKLLSIVLATVPPTAVMVARRPQESAHAGKLAQDVHISSISLLPMCLCLSTAGRNQQSPLHAASSFCHQHALLQASSDPRACLPFIRMQTHCEWPCLPAFATGSPTRFSGCTPSMPAHTNINGF